MLRKLDSVYRQFLKGDRGQPRFQPFHRYRSVAYKPGDGSAIKGGRLYIQNMGLIRVRWHCALPEGTLKHIIVVCKPSGWYVCLQIEMLDPEPAPHPGTPVGIDLGIHHALALSDGTVLDSLRSLEKSLKRLRVLHRTVARRKRGSHRRRKAVHQLARQHERIADQRRDFWHKVTRSLVDTYSVIALEDLSLTFMLRNPTLARAAHDIGLGMFRELLDYKAIEAGVEIVAVTPRNTSQACSGCGCMATKGLSVRVHRCPECFLVLDRDVNAARNILALALPPSGQGGQALTWAVGPSVA